jgi:hypothetical protein
LLLVDAPSVALTDGEDGAVLRLCSVAADAVVHRELEQPDLEVSVAEAGEFVGCHARMVPAHSGAGGPLE